MFLDMDDTQWIQEVNKDSCDEESDEEWYEEDFEIADEIRVQSCLQRDCIVISNINKRDIIPWLIFLLVAP